jgi:hypothetical protein
LEKFSEDYNFSFFPYAQAFQDCAGNNQLQRDKLRAQAGDSISNGMLK